MLILFIKESWKKIPQKYVKQDYCFQDISWVANRHIRMISERSCDTENWSNGCLKFSFAIIINGIFKYNIFIQFFNWLMNQSQDS